MIFTGKHYYLKMEYPCSVRVQIYDEILDFPSAENAFQAMKMLYSPTTKEQIPVLMRGFTICSPYEANALSEAIGYSKISWNRHKQQFLEEIVSHKFIQNTSLMAKLVGEPTSIESDSEDIGLVNALNKERNRQLLTCSNDNKVFETSYLEGGICFVKRRTILEHLNTVYNYTEILNERSRCKEITITKWNKNDESWITVNFASEESIFSPELTFESVEKVFQSRLMISSNIKSSKENRDEDY